MAPQLVLSVRQPWAWLIIHGGKDIENRTRRTNVRGRVLIHASKGMVIRTYNAVRDALAGTIELPPPEKLERGGIVGSVEIVDSVQAHQSEWFMGKWGHVLKDPKPLPFRPMRGQLGFFKAEPPCN